jgi:hypothetical protein
MLALLVTAAVNTWVVNPDCTVELLGDTVTVTGRVGAIAVRHALLPALAGAVLVAVVELNTAWAVSVRPASSVTTTCTVKLPEVGATTMAVLPLAGPVMLPAAVPSMIDQL